MTIALRFRDTLLRVLADGSYDVFIVDAAPDGADVMLLSLTVLSGPSKGEVIDVRAAGLGRDELDLLGLPGTLVVENGAPRVTVDD
jgi:anion-transporting  ArsA/GET3 family ATPase